ncbi:MAG TPA: sigma-70 family RNA polymerase sigma factor [Polyangia bacterium]|nr:sigma-70 family RNA polymerase sigma factor [Polyangia bacterium]
MWGDEPGDARVVGSLPRTEDPALVAAVAQGNREALGALYDLHAPLLFGLARRMLGNAAAAEDLLHDVFLEVWQHASEYSPDRGSVRSWLLVRTRSRALDRLGRGARESRVTQHLSLASEGEASLAPSPALSLDGARLRRLLGTLPAELVAVLDLTYFEGLSATEIAQRLGIPTGTVKSRLARALETLRCAIAPARAGGGTR